VSVKPFGQYVLGLNVCALLFIEELPTAADVTSPPTRKWAELWDGDAHLLTVEGDHAHDETILRQVADAYRTGYKLGVRVGARVVKQAFRNLLMEEET
jgi:hypothetical protein